ncbi:hypothetical protein ACIBQ1_10170 [Nonomuraea sp. NPDC050153]|uniref:hypothetical protein n=1 Tax=Nonomuraea sp. NPDC050153 TaxID=3364359 RepID=UPI0037B89EA2
MAKRAKQKPVPATAYESKGVPVLPGSIAPGAGKSIPKRLLGVAAAGLEADLHHPLWRLSLLDTEHNGAWAWAGVDRDTLIRIIDFLAEMERLSWKEIRSQMTGNNRRRGAKHKLIPVEHLVSAAQTRLRELELDEFDAVFRFRLSGPERLWGVISDESPRVFYPIWWDPQHKICPGRDKD